MEVHFCQCKIPVFDRLILINPQNAETFCYPNIVVLTTHATEDCQVKFFTRPNCNFVLRISFICYEYH